MPWAVLVANSLQWLSIQTNANTSNFCVKNALYTLYTVYFGRFGPGEPSWIAVLPKSAYFLLSLCENWEIWGNLMWDFGDFN